MTHIVHKKLNGILYIQRPLLPVSDSELSPSLAELDELLILRLASSSVDLSCSKFFSTTFCFWSTLIRVTELLNIVNQDTNYRLIIIYIYTSLVLFHAVESDLV
jgi:hypothetical protein